MIVFVPKISLLLVTMVTALWRWSIKKSDPYPKSTIYLCAYMVLLRPWTYNWNSSLFMLQQCHFILCCLLLWINEVTQSSCLYQIFLLTVILCPFLLYLCLHCMDHKLLCGDGMFMFANRVYKELSADGQED